MPTPDSNILHLLIVDDEPYLGEIYEGEFEEEIAAGLLVGGKAVVFPLQATKQGVTTLAPSELYCGIAQGRRVSIKPIGQADV